MFKKLILIANISFLGLVFTACGSKPSHKINLIQVENIVISSDKEEAKQGENVSLFYEINEKYEFLNFIVDDSPIEGTTFIMPDKEINVMASIRKIASEHNISTSYNEFIHFETENTSYLSGSIVEINYFPVYGYALDYFKVNNQKIDGTTFVMPDENVTIEAQEKKIYIESPVNIICGLEGREEYEATSNWFFEYLENSIHIYSIVKDHFIVDNKQTVHDGGLRDNVELIITPTKYANTSGLSINNSLNILESVDGYTWIKKANSVTTFSNPITVSKDKINITVNKYDYFNKDGMMGYRSDFYISYSNWSWSQNEEKSFVICPSFRNCVNAYKNIWDFYHGYDCDEYLNCSNHPLIKIDGTLERNPYHV